MRGLELKRWHIYVLAFVVVIVPLFRPMGLPITIGETTRAAVERLDALEPGDIIHVGIETHAPGLPELDPQIRLILPRLLEKGIGMVLISCHEEGALYGDMYIRYLRELGGVYGEDMAHLGFIAGAEVGLAGYADNPVAATGRDYYGNTVADLPIMQEIKDVRDFALALVFDAAPSGGVDSAGYVRQVYGTYRVDLVTGMTTLIVPRNLPYVEAGQIAGLIAGLRGAAEMELAWDTPGTGVALMDAQSLAHVLIVLLLILGNAAFIADKRAKKRDRLAKEGE